MGLVGLWSGRLTAASLGSYRLESYSDRRAGLSSVGSCWDKSYAKGFVHPMYAGLQTTTTSEHVLKDLRNAVDAARNGVPLSTPPASPRSALTRGMFHGRYDLAAIMEASQLLSTIYMHPQQQIKRPRSFCRLYAPTAEDQEPTRDCPTCHKDARMRAHQTDGQIDRQTDRQTARQADRQTEEEKR